MVAGGRRILVALALALLGAAPVRADDLSVLLDRMRAHSGPVWRTHLTSTSQVTLAGENAELRSDSLGVRFSSYECAENLCEGTYFNGEHLFSININGTTLPQSDARDPYLRGERTIASLAFLDPQFTASGGRIVEGDSAVVDGARYRTFIVDNGDATPMRVFVDPASATVRYMRDIDGDTTLEYRDYRAIPGGLVLPFLVVRNGEVLERYEERSTTMEAFAVPHGPTPSFAGPPVAVNTDPDRTIPIFPCTLGGIATSCLLDTGNSGLAVSDRLAERLHVPTVGSFQVRGLGNYSTDVVRAGTLEVGNATFPSANYVVLRDIHRFGYDVVLGADVLASTSVALDPVGHRIDFAAPSPTEGTSIPIVFQNFIPVMMVQLGKVGTQLALDTGDESNINLAYPFYEEHRDLFTATQQRSVSGVGGSSIELLGTIPEVRIGNLAATQQTIGATQTLRGTAFGHLGAAFLSHFNVVIDYASEAVHFVPTPAPSPSPSP